MVVLSLIVADYADASCIHIRKHICTFPMQKILKMFVTTVYYYSQAKWLEIYFLLELNLDKNKSFVIYSDCQREYMFGFTVNHKIRTFIFNLFLFCLTSLFKNAFQGKQISAWKVDKSVSSLYFLSFVKKQMNKSFYVGHICLISLKLNILLNFSHTAGDKYNFLKVQFLQLH